MKCNSCNFLQNSFFFIKENVTGKKIIKLIFLWLFIVICFLDTSFIKNFLSLRMTYCSFLTPATKVERLTLWMEWKKKCICISETNAAVLQSDHISLYGPLNQMAVPFFLFKLYTYTHYTRTNIHYRHTRRHLPLLTFITEPFPFY